MTTHKKRLRESRRARFVSGGEEFEVLSPDELTAPAERFAGMQRGVIWRVASGGLPEGVKATQKNCEQIGKGFRAPKGKKPHCYGDLQKIREREAKREQAQQEKSQRQQEREWRKLDRRQGRRTKLHLNKLDEELQAEQEATGIRWRGADYNTSGKMVTAIAQKLGHPKAKVARTMQAFFDSLAADLAEQGQAEIPGIGVLEMRQVPERRGRNPKTDQEIIIPAHQRAVFRQRQVRKGMSVEGIQSLITHHPALSGAKVEDVAQIMHGVQMALKAGMLDELTIPLGSLGKFQIKKQSARRARNPKTGEVVQVPAKQVLRFRPGRALKDGRLSWQAKQMKDARSGQAQQAAEQAISQAREQVKRDPEAREDARAMVKWFTHWVRKNPQRVTDGVLADLGAWNNPKENTVPAWELLNREFDQSLADASPEAAKLMRQIRKLMPGGLKNFPPGSAALRQVMEQVQQLKKEQPATPASKPPTPAVPNEDTAIHYPPAGPQDDPDVPAPASREPIPAMKMEPLPPPTPEERQAAEAVQDEVRRAENPVRLKRVLLSEPAKKAGKGFLGRARKSLSNRAWKAAATFFGPIMRTMEGSGFTSRLEDATAGLAMLGVGSGLAGVASAVLKGMGSGAVSVAPSAVLASALTIGLGAMINSLGARRIKESLTDDEKRKRLLADRRLRELIMQKLSSGELTADEVEAGHLDPDMQALAEMAGRSVKRSSINLLRVVALAADDPQATATMDERAMAEGVKLVLDADSGLEQRVQDEITRRLWAIKQGQAGMSALMPLEILRAAA